jgi:hypothetical protein
MDVYEVHACEMYAREVHAREVHAHEVYAYEMHVYEVHTHEISTRFFISCATTGYLTRPSDTSRNGWATRLATLLNSFTTGVVLLRFDSRS